MQTRLSLLPVLAAMFLFVSCKKGDTGPAGPKGTANVLYSAWFTPSTYVNTVVFSTNTLTYDQATTDITQAVIDSGTVITFGKLDGYTTAIWPAAQVAPLPINLTYIIGSTTMTDTWSALLTPGNLRIQFINDVNYYSGLANSHQFRYIIIPGGTKSTVISAAPGISIANARTFDNSVNEVRHNYAHMSYSEICQRLSIPE